MVKPSNASNDGLCGLSCTNRVKDSLCESGVITGSHEQLGPTKYKTTTWSSYNESLE